MKNKIYTTIGIVGLLSVMCFVIYLVGNFIYFGVYEVTDMCNKNTSNCYEADMSKPNNDSSRPVKGMKYKDSIDSLVFSNHNDLSGIDGDNFYSRDLNPGNRNITPRVNNYTSCDDEVEIILPTKITIKPSMIQVFNDRISYDVTYSY